ncbi:MAG: ATP-binding cassette domain-containing protein, partial [Hyphomicrobiales bacterium]|nr:ATP-binding cassette domain-containing protein [Hyphomicrobiales bacterium]
TLVKILTGVVRPDAGTIAVAGRARAIRSPAEAREAGLSPVHQDCSLIPDLTLEQNFSLTGTPLTVVQRWLGELGLGRVDIRAFARDLPLAALRVVDLARALAADPQILVLDETTAALPADLTETVFQLLARWRKAGRSLLFISHRLADVSAICDSVTVLRDGVTAGVVRPVRGHEDEIVDLMLGDVPRASAAAAVASPDLHPSDQPAALEARALQFGAALRNVSLEVRRGEILGVAALEGQGQKELFDCLAGVRRPKSGEIRIEGRPCRFGDPGDAIAQGVVLVPADRAQALLHLRSIRENIALPMVRRPASWGLIDLAREGRRVEQASARLEIDTRAQSEVRRLSGGNQQKVMIGRWLASGFKTLLCFDPTRGIDIGTKRQIYGLLREIAAGGAGVLIFTSELSEIQLVCDRVIVMFDGAVVGEMPARAADVATLLRAAHGAPSVHEPTLSHASPRAAALGPPTVSRSWRLISRNWWTMGVYALLGALFLFTLAVNPRYGAYDLRTLALAALPAALAAVAEVFVVLVGGIDLSVGALLAVANVLAASLMAQADFAESLLLAIVVLAALTGAGLLNGLLIVFTRVPDIVVTLATSFVWSGVALLILGQTGGGAPDDFQALATGAFIVPWLPNALVMLVILVAVVWLPIRSRPIGLSLFATGSDRQAAIRSGVNVVRARLTAYALSGFFSGAAGLALTMSTGAGDPLVGATFTLTAIATVALGGVNLAGGRGGMLGPLAAAYVLALISSDLVFLGVSPSYSQVIQGAMVVLVVMARGLAALRRSAG